MDIRTIKVMRVSKKEGATNKGGKTFAWVKYGFQDDKGAWYGCFSQEYKAICDFNNVDKIQEGMEIKAIVTEGSYNGKPTFDLSAPDKADMANQEIANIKAMLSFHNDRISALEAFKGIKPAPKSDYNPFVPNTNMPKEQPIDDEDLPF